MISQVPFFFFVIFLVLQYVSADQVITFPNGIKKEDLKSVPLFGSKPYPFKSVQSPVTGLKSTVRAPGMYFQGVFLLCEGPNPQGVVRYSFNRRTRFIVNYTPNKCGLRRVMGSIGYGPRYLNHARLWVPGLFTGLDTVFEHIFHCERGATGYIGITRVHNGKETLLAGCDATYEAHTYSWRI